MNMRPNNVTHLMCAIGVVGILSAPMLGGCDNRATASAPLSSKTNAPPDFVDADFGFRLASPIGWKVAPAQLFTVPGKVVRVWSNEDECSIVLFTQDPGLPLSAGQLLNATVGPMMQNGCKVSYQRVVKIAGVDAMSVKLTGPGTGLAMGGGKVPTYQHWVAIPKGNRVLVLLLTAPDAAKETAAKAFEELVRSVKVE